MPNPTTAILDNFNRADEDPLSGGGNWAASKGVFADRLVSNEAACTTVFSSSQSQWQAASFAADQEAYATLTVVGAVLGDDAGVSCRVTDAATAWNGYLARLEYPAPTAGGDQRLPVLGIGGGGLVYPGALSLLSKVDLGYNRLELVGRYISAGDRVWLSCVGDQIVAYHDHAGGGFEEVIRWTDTTWAAGGRIALYFQGPTTRVDDFGGGNV